jgi:hypothetical protein
MSQTCSWTWWNQYRSYSWTFQLDHFSHCTFIENRCSTISIMLIENLMHGKCKFLQLSDCRNRNVIRVLLKTWMKPETEMFPHQLYSLFCTIVEAWRIYFLGAHLTDISHHKESEPVFTRRLSSFYSKDIQVFSSNSGVQKFSVANRHIYSHTFHLSKNEIWTGCQILKEHIDFYN